MALSRIMSAVFALWFSSLLAATCSCVMQIPTLFRSCYPPSRGFAPANGYRTREESQRRVFGICASFLEDFLRLPESVHSLRQSGRSIPPPPHTSSFFPLVRCGHLWSSGPSEGRNTYISGNYLLLPPHDDGPDRLRCDNDCEATLPHAALSRTIKTTATRYTSGVGGNYSSSRQAPDADRRGVRTCARCAPPHTAAATARNACGATDVAARHLALCPGLRVGQQTYNARRHRRVSSGRDARPATSVVDGPGASRPFGVIVRGRRAANSGKCAGTGCEREEWVLIDASEYIAVLQ
ncbi:hypothetical protein K439DRAFT_1662497 [Ramaria rubella]|nr:hypothetical protein K439DRAFT_1662497 [Ramaria rubella]